MNEVFAQWCREQALGTDLNPYPFARQAFSTAAHFLETEETVQDAKRLLMSATAELMEQGEPLAQEACEMILTLLNGFERMMFKGFEEML